MKNKWTLTIILLIILGLVLFQTMNVMTLKAKTSQEQKTPTGQAAMKGNLAEPELGAQQETGESDARYS